MKYILPCLLLILFVLAGCAKPATPCNRCPCPCSKPCPACPNSKEDPR